MNKLHLIPKVTATKSQPPLQYIADRHLLPLIAVEVLCPTCPLWLLAVSSLLPKAACAILQIACSIFTMLQKASEAFQSIATVVHTSLQIVHAILTMLLRPSAASQEQHVQTEE